MLHCAMLHCAMPDCALQHRPVLRCVVLHRTVQCGINRTWTRGHDSFSLPHPSPYLNLETPLFLIVPRRP